MKLKISIYGPVILAAILQANLALAQKEVAIGPARIGSPKTVTIRLVASATTPYSTDKIVDSTAVLYRRENKYTSTPIKLSTSEGTCTIEQVVPGKYRLELQALGIDTSIKIPETTSNEVTLLVRLNRSGISVRVLSAKSK
jgi:hypothetical protein